MEVLTAESLSSCSVQLDDHKINQAEQDAIEALSQIFFLNSSAVHTTSKEEKGEKDQKLEKKENSQETAPKDKGTCKDCFDFTQCSSNDGAQNCTFNPSSLRTQEPVKETEVTPLVTVPVTKEPIHLSPQAIQSDSLAANCSETHFDLREDTGKKRKATMIVKTPAKEIRICSKPLGLKPTPISPKLWEHNLFSASQTTHSFSPQPGSSKKDYPFLTTLPQLHATTTSFVPLSPVNYRRNSITHANSSTKNLKNYVSEQNSNFPLQAKTNPTPIVSQAASQYAAFQPFQPLSGMTKFSSSPVDSSCPLPSLSETTSTISFHKGNLSIGSSLQASSSSVSCSAISPLSPQSPSQSPKTGLSFHPSSPPMPSSPLSPGTLRDELPEESKSKLQQQIQDLIAVHHEKLRFDLKSQIQKHYDLHFQQQAGIKQQVQHLIKKYQERKMICPHPPTNERLENILYGPDECAVRQGNN